MTPYARFEWLMRLDSFVHENESTIPRFIRNWVCVTIERFAFSDELPTLAQHR